jgi:hypothetical protein
MTATAERTKLDTLRAKEADLTIEVEAARARIAEYPALLHDARSRAIYANPNVRPGAELNGEVAKITARERKDLAALNGLESDISAVRSVLAVESQRESERTADATRKQLAKRHELEESSWAHAGSVFAELANAWDRYLTLREESTSYARSNGLDATDALAVRPAPASFREFIALLLAASTDEDVRSEPHTEELVDSGIYGRRGSNGEDLGGAVYDTRVVGTRTFDTRRRIDERDILFRVIPDLRSAVRSPTG